MIYYLFLLVLRGANRLRHGKYVPVLRAWKLGPDGEPVGDASTVYLRGGLTIRMGAKK